MESFQIAILLWKCKIHRQETKQNQQMQFRNNEIGEFDVDVNDAYSNNSCTVDFATQTPQISIGLMKLVLFFIRLFRSKFDS